MTKEIVSKLVACPKSITIKPRKAMYRDQRNNYTMRNEFSCVSTDSEDTFEVFMRSSVEFPTVFSIGLKYHTVSGFIIICRYNGKHYHKNKIGNKEIFNDYHIHMLYDHQLSDETVEALDAVQADNYISFDEALFAFLNDCHIENWRDHFPELEYRINQLTLEGV